MRENSERMNGASDVMLNSNDLPSSSVQGIASNTNDFFDSTPQLLKALEKVGQLHPFAGGTRAQCHDLSSPTY